MSLTTIKNFFTRLGWLLNGGNPKLLAMRRMANAGRTDAQVAVATCCLKGLHGAKQDTKEALHWFHRAAQGGDVESQALLGSMYALGRHVEQDMDEAVHWHRLAAQGGDAGAQCFMGRAYAEGRNLEQDDREARRWLRAAAEQGDADAQLWLARLYAEGRGGPRDLYLSIEWYEKAMAQGSELAKYMLGCIHCYGDDESQAADRLRPDFARAMALLEPMARAGDKGAQKLVDRMERISRECGGQDPRLPLAELAAAAGAGDQEAQRQLAIRHYTGYGTPADMVQAFRWFCSAAELGDISARHNLASMYLHGEGTPADPQAALHWYQLAAEQGHPISQSRLGGIYLEGKIVERDEAAATQWLERAAAQGEEEAQKMLEGLLRGTEGVQENGRQEEAST